jgi:hypothetical protein
LFHHTSFDDGDLDGKRLRRENVESQHDRPDDGGKEQDNGANTSFLFGARGRVLQVA